MRIRPILVAAILLAGLFALAAPLCAQGSVSVSISVFHENLSPHGSWVVAGSYGNVWVPAGVAAGWAPYVDGQWVSTDYGWTWVSNDPWGDIPYHYGTWVWAEPYGWTWVPGTVWAPAWVTWAYTDDYIGWAPVPPTFALSVNGYRGRPIVVSETHYCFVPTRQFVGVNVSTVRLSLHQNNEIFRHATKVTRYKVSGGVVRTAGPPTSRIEKAMGHRIERVSIERAKTRPTTLAAGGMLKGKSLAVVAPARERARAIQTSEKKSGGKRPETPTKERRASVAKPKPVKPEKPAASASKGKGEKPQMAKSGKPDKPLATAPAKPRPNEAQSARQVKKEKASPKQAAQKEKPKDNKKD